MKPCDAENYELITLTMELENLSIQDNMTEEEKNLTRICLHLYDLLKNDLLSDDDKEKSLLNLKQAYFRLCRLREENEKNIEKCGSIDDEARKRYDKAISIFKNIKTPCYTSDPNKRGIPEKNILPLFVQGVEDPFFEQFNEIYPAQGLKGFIEENPKLFNNTTQSDINLASERYKKVDGICTMLGEWLRIPLLVGFILLFPEMTRQMSPFLYCLSAYGIYISFINGLCRMTGNSRLRHDDKIFDARCRLAKDMGILKEESFRKDNSIKESFKFDYGKKDDIE